MTQIVQLGADAVLHTSRAIGGAARKCVGERAN